MAFVFKHRPNNANRNSAFNLAHTGRFENMHVEIVLEQPHTTWTNLDVIRGKVVMKLFSSTPISSIVVKLEGESRSRLRAAPRQTRSGSDGTQMVATTGKSDDEWANEKSVVREELHKVLYRVAMVFPESNLEKAATSAWTLPSGQFEYPFSFKVPFNNSCSDSSKGPSSSLAQIAGLKRGPTLSATHVKKTLPPTLTAFPGLAEIRYFLKVTVHRKEFYKENPRVIQNLNFLPIEPPRPPGTGNEIYARRTHHFVGANGSADKSKKGLLNTLKKTTSKDGKSAGSKVAVPAITVDARLPSPAVITCNEDLPLRLLVKRVNEFPEQLYLESLHIQLRGTTRITAQELSREESSNWVLVSKSGMGMPLWSKSGGVGKEGEEIEVDAGAWRNKRLPNSVAPTFETCNISRTYRLEIQVGISCDKQSSKNTTTIPLHHPVQVFSGITPPPALLAAMAKAGTIPTRKPVTGSNPPEKFDGTPSTYLQEATGQASGSAIPATSQPGPISATASTSQYGPLPPGEEEPPPSYEDAIAEDLPPLDGRRREYNPPPVTEGRGGFGQRKGSRDS